MSVSKRAVVYEVPLRWFGNRNGRRLARGTLSENGCGHFDDLNDAALEGLRALGATHLWLLGVLRHATLTAYPGLPADPPDVVKGVAGSYFAVRDAFDVCPDLAQDPCRRMSEFVALLDRIHAHDMRVLIDLVPNHVARSYHSVIRPELDFGRCDDRTVFFKPSNNFFYLVDPPGQALSIDAPPGWRMAEMTGTVAWEDGIARRVPRASGNNQTAARLSPYDWYDTVKLNYGYNFVTGEAQFDPIPDTWWKIDEQIGYWQTKGVDGFRCDFAHWIPLEFWRFAIARARARDADVFFLGEAFDNWDAVPGYSKAALIHAGFNAVYDEPAFRTVKRIAQGVGWANDLDRLLDAGPLVGRLARYLENHDERRAASPLVAGVEPRDSGLGSARAGVAAAAALWLGGCGPVLVYAGQESGEEGMDAEGYSGVDGRTTIFDYWSLPKLMAWSNGGLWDGGASSWAERECRKAYGKLIQIARRPEFAQGEAYGLNHANRNERSYGQHGRWVWSVLRYQPHAGPAAMCVLNLSSAESFEPTICIPADAQRLMGWPDRGEAVLTAQMQSSLRIRIGLDALATSGVSVPLPCSCAEVFRIALGGDAS